MTSKSDPGKHWFAVTPSDATEFNPPLRSLWVGTEGTVTIVNTGSSTPVAIVAAKGILPFDNILQVRATGTTASDIVGIW